MDAGQASSPKKRNKVVTAMRPRQISVRARWLIVLSAMLVVASAGAQTKSLKQYVHRSWSSDDGLPENAVTFVTQTRDGYLWVATPEGVARFNGKQFTAFDQTNTPELQASNFIVLLEDSKQDILWMGSFSGGLTRYSEGKWKSYTSKNGLPDDYVVALANDGDDNLWIGTAKGLAVMRAGRISRFAGDQELAEKRTQALWAAPDGGVWAAAGNHVFKLNSAGKIEARLDISDPSALFVDRAGALWIGTVELGIYKFSRGKLDHYARRELQNRINAIREDGAGHLWVGMLVGGVCRLAAGSVECLSKKDGISGDNVDILFVDREGSVWTGTFPGGLTRLTEGKFITYNHTMGLSQDLVWSVSGTADGSIWAGTMNGLNQIKQGRIKSYKGGPKRPDNVALTVADNGKGTLWVGTAGGLKILRDNKLTRSGVPSALANIGIRALFYDKSGNLWMGTREDKLVQLKDGKVTTFTEKDGIASTAVHSIAQDHEGNLWFAATGWFTQLRNGKFTNYSIPTPPGKGAEQATCFYEDRDHVLWIGTNTLGLVRFENGRRQLLTKKIGPLSRGVWGILEDNQGYFWLSSSRGLSRVRRSELNNLAADNKSTVNYATYRTVDGLSSDDFNGGMQSGAWKGNDGKLYFAQLGGVVVVDPEHMPVNQVPPPVYVDSVTSEGQPVEDRAELVGKRDLEFQFAGLSFVAPEHMRYEYQLEGFDPEWVPSEKNTAAYPHLPPGTYRFHVRAFNNDGIRSNADASFDVVLKPQFYKTTWFISLCALGCILVGVCVNVLRVRRMKRRLHVLVDEHTLDLRQAKEAAEAAARAKTQFLANMSHEIRTPLNGVLGMLQVVKQTKLTDEQFGCLSIADQSATALLHLINEVLDFSKIEAGRMEVSSEQFDPAETIMDGVQALAMEAHGKHLELCCRISPSVPALMVGDPRKLKQVLLNLVGNAIKFTQEGEVTASAEATTRFDLMVELKICVADNGIGIAPEHQQMIFDSFRQADSSATRRFGGTGLGLAISSRLTALMGGKIWVESQLGKGARFYFTALLKEVTNRQASANERSFEGCSALIIDDNATSRKILAEMLGSLDMRPVAVDSATAGLAYLNANPCDVILLDSDMGGTDSLEMMYAQAGQACMRSVIVMLTSADYHDRAVRCREVGAATSLVKPLRKSELVKAIAAILYPDQQQDEEKRHEVHAVAATSGPLRILLAEDNAINQKLAVRLLEKNGHKVSVAVTGKEVLDQLEKSSFDLVLMDVQMPEMDGLTATRVIRHLETQTGRHLPIIAMTAHAMKGDRERCLEAGMDEYLSKPINVRELHQTIHQVLSSLEERSPA